MTDDETVEVKEIFFENLEDQSRFVALLKTAGIVKAMVCYDGQGDDGQVDGHATFYDILGKPISPPTGKVRVVSDNRGVFGYVNLHEAMQNMCYVALDDFDWVNNDGGYGEFTLNFAQSPFLIKLGHNQRITETEYHERVW